MISLSDLLFLPLCTDVLGIVESYCEFHPNVWLSEVAYWLSSNFNVPLTSFRVLKERRLFFCMPFSVYTQWDRFVRKTMFFLFGNHTPCAHLRATDEVVFAVKRSIVCHIEQKMIKLKRQGTNWFRQHLTPQEQKDRPVNWVNYTLFDVDERAIDRMLAFFQEHRCEREEYKLRRGSVLLQRRTVSGYTFIPPIDLLWERNSRAVRRSRKINLSIAVDFVFGFRNVVRVACASHKDMFRKQR